MWRLKNFRIVPLNSIIIIIFIIITVVVITIIIININTSIITIIIIKWTVPINMAGMKQYLEQFVYNVHW